MATAIQPYGFDPTHGYTLESLFQVGAPPAPEDFALFWQRRYDRALALAPKPVLRDTGVRRAGWRIFDVEYDSTDGWRIGGWLLLPADSAPRRGLIVTHGYGGRDAPDLHLPFKDAALFFPCLRGLGRSKRPPVSDDPQWHVLHDVDKVDRYIIGGCVEDVWLAVSALLSLFPDLSGHLGYCGVSFGGGIGALCLPWEQRLQRAHLSVPTFGNHPLRLTLENLGSGASLTAFHRTHGDLLLNTLCYYDAATAAAFIRQPVHCALAKFDPSVPPAGQFAVYNAITTEKKAFILTAGHHDYPEMLLETKQLIDELKRFFISL